MTYSLDFRRPILKVREEAALSFDETTRRFKLGKTSLFWWSQRVEPKRTRNKPTTSVNMERLKQDSEQYHNAYQYERAARLGVSRSRIYWALKRLVISYGTVNQVS
jgi:hypothetical protein